MCGRGSKYRKLQCKNVTFCIPKSLNNWLCFVLFNQSAFYKDPTTIGTPSRIWYWHDKSLPSSFCPVLVVPVAGLLFKILTCQHRSKIDGHTTNVVISNNQVFLWLPFFLDEGAEGKKSIQSRYLESGIASPENSKSPRTIQFCSCSTWTESERSSPGWKNPCTSLLRISTSWTTSWIFVTFCYDAWMTWLRTSSATFSLMETIWRSNLDCFM